MRLVILLFGIAFSTLVKGRERDKVEEKGCEELHGQCISNDMSCHSTDIIYNSDCSSDKKCCNRPNKENGDEMLENLNKCEERKKCKKKGGVCKKQCAILEKKTKGCIRKKGCKCCIPKCKANRKCTEAGGFCVKDGIDCKGTLSKDCKGRRCRCCVEGKTCPYNNSTADNTNLKVQGCTWVVGSTCYPTKPPIIVFENDPTLLVLPVRENDENRVRVPVGSILLIACSGSQLIAFGEPTIRATCSENGLLKYGGKFYSIRQMACDDIVKSSVKTRTIRVRCGLNQRGIEYHIGFEMTPYTFLPLIDVCFWHSGVTSLWTKHTIRGINLPARPAGIASLNNWVNDAGFFSLTQNQMDFIYVQANQRQYLRRNGIRRPALQGGIRNMFQKGHLSTRSDFVTQAESDATFHYINALPQYGVINNGNWKVLEGWANNLAFKLGEDIVIYSGGFDLLELINGENMLSFYLGDIVDPPALLEVPVPAAFWKIVIHEQRAIAFVVNNNPIANEVPAALCPNSIQTCALLFNLILKQEMQYGYTLCCDVNELKNSLNNHVNEFENDLPPVQYTGILRGLP